RAPEVPHRLAVGLLLDPLADGLLARPVHELVVGVAVDEVEERTERARRIDVLREALAEQLELTARRQDETDLDQSLALRAAPRGLLARAFLAVGSGRGRLQEAARQLAADARAEHRVLAVALGEREDHLGEHLVAVGEPLLRVDVLARELLRRPVPELVLV